MRGSIVLQSDTPNHIIPYHTIPKNTMHSLPYQNKPYQTIPCIIYHTIPYHMYVYNKKWKVLDSISNSPLNWLQSQTTQFEASLSCFTRCSLFWNSILMKPNADSETFFAFFPPEIEKSRYLWHNLSSRIWNPDQTTWWELSDTVYFETPSMKPNADTETLFFFFFLRKLRIPDIPGITCLRISRSNYLMRGSIVLQPDKACFGSMDIDEIKCTHLFQIFQFSIDCAG